MLPLLLLLPGNQASRLTSLMGRHEQAFPRVGLILSLDLIIMDLTREPNAGASQPPAKISFYAEGSTELVRQRVLLFACGKNNKSYYSAKHNHELEQVRIRDHRHQLLSS